MVALCMTVVQAVALKASQNNKASSLHTLYIVLSPAVQLPISGPTKALVWLCRSLTLAILPGRCEGGWGIS